MESKETIHQFCREIIKSHRKERYPSSSIDKDINIQYKYPNQNALYWQEAQTFDVCYSTAIIVGTSNKTGMYMNDG